MDDNRSSLSAEELIQVSGGAELNVADYSEAELARIFDLYFEMYGHTAALSYLKAWGVTAGDYYIMLNRSYWDGTEQYSGTSGERLAHLIYRRNH